MVREKDPFWKYVEIVNGRRSCKFCKQRFSGKTSISRIKSHLAGVSRRDVKVCPKVREDVQLSARQAINIGASKKKARSTESLENVEETASVSSSSSSLMKGAHQSNVLKICNKKDKSVVDDKLIKFIISNDISLDVIQSPSFIDFMKSVTKFGPSYELPSRSSVVTKSVPTILEEKISKYVTSVKNSFAVTGCTLMCNVEDDYLSDSRYVSIFACTPRGMVVIDSLKFSRETFDIELFLSVTVESVGSDHVTQLLYPEYRYLSEYPQTIITTCASSQIQDLLEGIYDIQWVEDIISIARTIVAYIVTHNVNLSLRREYIRSKKVARRLTPNEFVTDFLTLHLILQVENELQALQLPISSSSCTRCFLWCEDRVTKHAKYEAALSCIFRNNAFWKGVREVVQVLQPIFEVFHLVDDYMSTSGYLYEAWQRARDKIKACLNKNQEKYEPIWQAFKDCQICLIRPIYKAAAFLNPAYMLSENFKEDIEIKEGIEYVVETLVALEDKEAFVKQIQRYRNKEPCTFTDTAMSKLRTTHPRKWWECCGNHLPVLQKYAIRIMSQPCSTLSCEQYKLDLRGSNNAILHVNKRLMEQYSMLGALDEELIDLDKISEFLAYADKDLDIEDSFRSDIYWEKIISDKKYEGIMDRWL